MSDKHFDLCVIGGGINGTGVARDAAMRGLSVLLLEAQDLANSTSSSSTKLIHGGLRYLEYYEFKLVREALKERETLLGLAPHIIWPMRFVLPHDQNQRPAWLIRMGLFLYDHLAKRKKLPGSNGVSLTKTKYGLPLNDAFTKGFIYSDCWVEDSRLVVLNAMDAQNHGAHIMTRNACTKIEHSGDHWTIHTKNMVTSHPDIYSATKIINAAGPWVRGLLDESDLSKESTPKIRLVKGSHIVVPKMYDGEHSYILQQEDGRIIFTIPYEYKYTLIGTTDVEVTEDPASVSISQDEIDYLLEAIAQAFKKPLSADDIVWSYSGVRPLLDDGDDNASAVTRDYKLIHDHHDGLDLLSIFGGKITTYRTLAKDAVDKIYSQSQDIEHSQTHLNVLPGGDIPNGDFDHYIENQKRRYSKINENLLFRLARAYGTKMDDILGPAPSPDKLGIHFGDDLYEAEIRYLLEHEFAMTAEDILWRRSKLGLHLSKQTQQALEDFFKHDKISA